MLFCLYCFELLVLLEWLVNFFLRNILVCFVFFLIKVIFDLDLFVEVGIGFFFLCLGLDIILVLNFYKVYILKFIKVSIYINWCFEMKLKYVLSWNKILSIYVLYFFFLEMVWFFKFLFWNLIEKNINSNDILVIYNNYILWILLINIKYLKKFGNLNYGYDINFFRIKIFIWLYLY